MGAPAQADRSLPGNVDSSAGSGGRLAFMTPGRWLAVIVLLALAIRILAILTRGMVQFDETAYLRMAENLAAGHKPYEMTGNTAVHFSPFFPVLIAAFHFLLRDFVVSGYAVVAVFGSLLAVPFYLLGRDLLSPRAGLLAAALIAVMPFFISTSEFVYSEQSYIFFLLMGIFASWQMLKYGRLKCGAMAGLMLGLAYLTNPAGIFYFFAVAALVLAVAWRKKLWGKMIRAGALFALVFLVPALPYLVFLHAETGHWTFTGKNTGGLTYAAQHNLERDSSQKNEEVMAQLDQNGELLIIDVESEGVNPLGTIISQPVSSAKTLAKQIYYLHKNVLAQVFPLFLLVFVGMGLFARGWDRGRATALGFLAVMTLPVLLVLATYAFARAMMPYIPILVLLAGEGWRHTEEWAANSAHLDLRDVTRAHWERLGPWLVGALVLIPMLLMTVNDVSKQTYPVQYKEAGEWVKEKYGSHGLDTKIMTRDAASAYYAGATMVSLPYASMDEVTRYAMRNQTNFIIISRGDIQAYRPGLAPLLNEDWRANSNWELVNEVEPGTDRDTLVLRLKTFDLAVAANN